MYPINAALSVSFVKPVAHKPIMTANDVDPSQSHEHVMLHTRYIPGAAAPASVLLELTPACLRALTNIIIIIIEFI